METMYFVDDIVIDTRSSDSRRGKVTWVSEDDSFGYVTVLWDGETKDWFAPKNLLKRMKRFWAKGEEPRRNS